MQLPTLKQLRYLLALQKTQHFGKAAALCFVSQSAFSTAIKELENILNICLVERNNKQMTFTPAGLEICQRASNILNESRALVECAHQFENPFSGQIRIGIIPTIAPFLAVELINRVQQDHPNLKLLIEENPTAVLHQKLLTAEIDLSLMALPITLKNTQQLVVAQDHFHLIYHQDKCPWATTPAPNWPDKSVILLAEGHCLSDHTISACDLQPQHQISDFKASSLTSLFALTQAGVGISYVTDLMLRHTLPERINSLYQPHSYRDIALIWRQSSPKSALHDYFQKILKDIIKG